MRATIEPSPWMRCPACEACQWWTGWLCRNEPTGFRDCPHYGTSFPKEVVVALDRVTGEAKYVTLAQGETTADLIARSKKTPLEPIDGRDSGWCNLMAIVDKDEPYDK